MKKHYLIYIILFFQTATVWSNIRVPAILSDHMILQRNAQVLIWGWADPGENITLSATWLRDRVTTVADSSGEWKVSLRTNGSKASHTIRITGKNTLLIRNILFGEVWLCSGQSNMEWSFRILKSDTNSTIDYATEQKKVNDKEIRFFHVEHAHSDMAQTDCNGKWVVCRPGNADDISAVAWYFGRAIHRELDVPVGLIGAYWGGTPIQSWISRQGLNNFEHRDFYLQKEHQTGWPVIDNCRLFNAMVHPLLNFRIKGAIWYQGEANVPDHIYYTSFLESLISDWRNCWDNQNLSFYYAQIAPYHYPDEMTGALLREAQLKAMNFRGAGMAVTMDIATPDNIHPFNKIDVGERLALWALVKDYNIAGLEYSGPVYRASEISGDRIILRFDHSGGLHFRNDSTGRFLVAGPDRNFYPGVAQIEGENVVVTSAHVPTPVAVRYAFSNTDEGFLMNSAGLPASSFRTDNWPVATDKVKIISRYDTGENSLLIEMTCDRTGLNILYTTDGSLPGPDAVLYSGPFALDRSAVIQARAFEGDNPSVSVASARFIKHKGIGSAVVHQNLYSPNYQGGGDFGLVNGICGSNDFLDGKWQGYAGTDLNCTVTLPEFAEADSLSIGFLQNISSWIWLPEFIEVFCSNDGIHFREAAKVINGHAPDKKEPFRYEFKMALPGIPCRYFRIKAKNRGVCPGWHPGNGQSAWIFADEIMIY